MIKINLLRTGQGIPGPSVSSLQDVGSEVFVSEDQIRKEALMRLVILLLPIIALYLYGQQSLPKKNEELKAKNKILTEITEYNSKESASVAEIKKFKEDEASIQSRITVLNNLAKDRFREIHFLDLIQQVLPAKAWLKKIEVGDRKVVIQGFAQSDSEVSIFMESLTKSAFLADVNLLNSAESLSGGINIKNFEISCVLLGDQ